MSAIDYFKLRLEATYSPMDTIKALKDRPEEVYVVDVRNGPPNLLKEKIKGAVLIPQAEISHRINELPKDREIILYCWDTWCSLAVKSAVPLLEAGLSVKELYGGISAWNILQLPTEPIEDAINTATQSETSRCEC
ncbi:MAG: rhodanese-like domain-containing protein [Rhodocyclaceae bacterium]|nr:rhodanese-like domain-containing protein [Rhodocyclaceae bacterium]